jgi:hypothetical protein
LYGLNTDFETMAYHKNQYALPSQWQVLEKISLAVAKKEKTPCITIINSASAQSLNPIFYLPQEQAMIERGKEYMHTIMHHEDPFTSLAHSSPTDYIACLEALIWYLHFYFHQKGEYFHDVTFVIQDTPDYKLYNFLLRCMQHLNPGITGTAADPARMISTHRHAYSRVSSHFKHSQKIYRHYSFDSLHKLPGNCTHILFGKLKPVNNQHTLEPALFFIKPEPYGLYKYNAFFHGLHYVRAQLRKFFAAILPSRLYFYVGRLLGDHPDKIHRREEMPSTIFAQFKKSVRQLPIAHKIKRDYMRKARQGGIKTIIEIAGNHPESSHLATLKQELENTYAHATLRTGNEAIVTYKELLAHLVDLGSGPVRIS